MDTRQNLRDACRKFLSQGLRYYPKDLMLDVMQDMCGVKRKSKRTATIEDVQAWIGANSHALRALTDCWDEWWQQYQRWFEYRQSFPKPMQIRGLTAQIELMNEMEHAKPGAAVAAMKYTAAMGWQGLCPLQRIPDDMFTREKTTEDKLRDVIR